jgi:hypothetical protein
MREYCQPSFRKSTRVINESAVDLAGTSQSIDFIAVAAQCAFARERDYLGRAKRHKGTRTRQRFRQQFR